jgi:tetratricopeptide (TPR) repeat protein
MTRVRTAVEQKDTDLALELLDKIIVIKPDYVEAWNRRATIYFMKNDYGKSLADIREVLKREPRHFGALSGLGIIFEELDQPEKALAAYQAALAIHPHLASIKEAVERLETELEGQDL